MISDILPQSLERIRLIPRQPDGSSFYLHFSGGLRAGKIEEDRWCFEPLLVDGKPSTKGFLTTSELQKLTAKLRLKPIAFQDMGWFEGRYSSDWIPIHPKRTRHGRGPALLWGSIAYNLSKNRTEDCFQSSTSKGLDDVSSIVDDRTREEALARSISLSLKSIDITVEQISNYYHENLINLSAAGQLGGQQHATMLDQNLYANVHSFFLHLGAARDYLGAYLAEKTGVDSRKVDDMARFVNQLTSSTFGIDPVVDMLREKQLLMPVNNLGTKWTTGGWLKRAGDLRKLFVHNRPYGLMSSERFGWLIPLAGEIGCYRYFRPMHNVQLAEPDVFDEILHHYQHSIELFQEAAEVSGRDTSMAILTDNDMTDLDS